jgi:hypothetical protein
MGVDIEKVMDGDLSYFINASLSDQRSKIGSRA